MSFPQSTRIFRSTKNFGHSKVSSSKYAFGSQTERSLCASVQVPGHPIGVFGSEQAVSTDRVQKAAPEPPEPPVPTVPALSPAPEVPPLPPSPVRFDRP